jgi:hypothetical protein
MTDNHPIIPSHAQTQQWADEAMQGWRTNGIYERDIATLAAQWGADQELDACCKLFEFNSVCGTKFQRRSSVRDLRDKRRPKPPSLKKQAFTAMLHLQKAAETNMDTIKAVHIICQALEALPND